MAKPCLQLVLNGAFGGLMRFQLSFLRIFSSLTLALTLPAMVGNTWASNPRTIGNLQAPKGGQFSFNINKEPVKLNPITSTDLYSTQVQAYVMETLMASVVL